MQLGRYEIVRDLGKGAMGVVYLAKDPVIGRMVALKTIRLTATSDDEEAHEYQQRFVREAQAAGVLSHPSIVTVHDIGQDPVSGMSFIAMEYVEGSNLKELLSQGRELKFDEVGNVIAQVADALDYAHARGIIHRDVKPANIIICDDSRVKITDFGIAKIVSGAANLTTTGQFLGTPNYMAPEQIKGLAVDGRSDIFSLGIVLYECLTRRKPFAGDSLTTISYKIVHEPFVPLRDLNPGIPDGFETIIMHALAKEPAKRYARASELATDLRRLLRGEVFDETPFQDVGESTEITMAHELREISDELESPFPGSPGTSARESPTAMAGSPESNQREAPVPQGARKRHGSGLRSRVSTPLFFAIIAALALPLVAIAWSISRQQVAVPVVDTTREALVARQRVLRLRAQSELKSGNVTAAYLSLKELQKLEPNSPSVNLTIQKLEQVQTESTTKSLKLAEADAKMAEGRALYQQKKYAEAMPLFEQAFDLNPNLADAVNFLAMSREQVALAEMRKKPKALPVKAPPVTRAPTTPARAVVTTVGAVAPSTLITSLNSPVSDGYIQVHVNSRLAVYEKLAQDKGMLRRRTGRKIEVSRQVPAGQSYVDVWVVVPSLGMSAHRRVTQIFTSGKTHNMTITIRRDARQFDVNIS